MIIQTFEHGYTVIHLQKTLPCGMIYICRDMENGGDYTILCVTDQEVIPKLVTYLTTKVNPGVFTDYSEHFFWDGQLCVVFRHTIGTTLEQRLESAMLTLRERLEIGRKILERIVLIEPPAVFLLNCLNPQRIMVDDGLEIRFNYEPEAPDMIASGSCDASEISGQLYGIFTLLFKKETERRLPRPLIHFIGGLKDPETLDFLGLCTAYSRMTKEVLALPEDEMLPPDTVPFRLWEKVKKLLKKLKKVLMWLLIIAATAYLIFTIRDVSSGKGTASVFERIGDIEILK